jgi:hypothetical protein
VAERSVFVRGAAKKVFENRKEKELHKNSANRIIVLISIGVR